MASQARRDKLHLDTLLSTVTGRRDPIYVAFAWCLLANLDPRSFRNSFDSSDQTINHGHYNTLLRASTVASCGLDCEKHLPRMQTPKVRFLTDSPIIQKLQVGGHR